MPSPERRLPSISACFGFREHKKSFWTQDSCADKGAKREREEGESCCIEIPPLREGLVSPANHDQVARRAFSWMNANIVAVLSELITMTCFFTESS